MEFRTYDEVEGTHVARLNISAFGWNLDSKSVSKIRKNDKNCPDWFALYAVEKGEVMSLIGAVFPLVESTEGTMKVGFFCGVVTSPKHARKGLSRALFKKLHERMHEDGAELFILGTGQTLVAHQLYFSLGYRDFQTFDLGSRRGRRPKKPNIKLKVRKRSGEEIYRLHKSSNKEQMGFVHRHPNFVAARLTWGWWGSLDNVCTFLRDDRVIGYALISTNPSRLMIREICCPNTADIPECITALEHRFPSTYTVCDLHTRGDIQKALGEVDLSLDLTTYGVLMGRVAKRSRSVKTLLGYGTGRFNFTTVDSY